MTPTIDQLLHTLTKVCNTLASNGIRFAVAGGCAAYARGGPPSDHDVDVFVKPADVTAAVSALVEAGLRAADPPENWLRKVYDRDILVDLIFRPNDRPITDELLDRSEPMRVGTTTALVVTGTDLMIDKLLVLDAHRLDLAPLLRIARALREQVDWTRVRQETSKSPYARAFLGLLADLDVITTDTTGAAPAGHSTEPQYVAAHLHRALAEDPQISELAIRVEVTDDAVRLTGRVANRQRHARIEELARAHAGAVRVHNEVEVMAPEEPFRIEDVR